LQSIEIARTTKRPRGSPIAHGRKAIRTQSAILEKDDSKPLLLLTITVFLVRMVSIPTKKRRLARTARNGCFWNETALMTTYIAASIRYNSRFANSSWTRCQQRVARFVLPPKKKWN
jgi:hypothetical protein